MIVRFLTALSLLTFLCGFTTVADASAAKRMTNPRVVTVASEEPLYADAPDFAYPQTVVKDSEARLKKALRDGADPEVVRSLADILLAQTSVSIERQREALKEVVRERDASTSPVVKSMLDLLVATALTDIYLSNSQYDSRTIPLRPFSEDYSEWSGQQFRDSITTLIDNALAARDVLKTVKAADYASVIDHGDMTFVYYPTLYDFAAYNSIRLLERIDRTGKTTVPARALSSADEFVAGSYDVSTITGKILSIYAGLLETNRNATAPFIVNDLNRLQYAMRRGPSYNDESTQRMIADLRALYDRYSDSEYSGDILQCINRYRQNGSDDERRELKKWLYVRCGENIDRFPAYRSIDCLRSICQDIAQQNISVSYPDMFALGKEIEIKCTMTNVNAAEIRIFKIEPDNQPYNINVDLSDPGTLVAKLPVEVAGEVPFAADTVLTWTSDAPGWYVAIPFIGDKEAYLGSSPSDRKAWMPPMVCTDLGLFVTTSGSTNNIWSVDPSNGKPVSGADIYMIDNSNRTKEIRLGVSSAGKPLIYDGVAKGQPVYAVKGADRSCSIRLPWGSNAATDMEANYSNLLTSLALYHPGDSVEWAAVVYHADNKGKTLVAGGRFTVTMYDVNGNEVASADVVSDNFGRVDGRFLIPTGDLIGYYSLRITLSGENPPVIGYSQFMVSDYKMPTFAVTLDRPLIGQPSAGDVTVAGKVVTYSGFPLADSNVTLTLSASPRWYFFNNREQPFYTVEAVTDGDGAFNIVLDKAVLERSPYVGGRYNVTVSATSTAGETHEATDNFMLRQAYAIRPFLSNTNIDAAKPFELSYRVVNSRDETVDQPVYYSLVKNTETADTVMSGVLLPSPAKLDLSSVVSGSYRLVMTLSDPEAAQEVSRDIVLYRPSDRLSPVDDVLWTPDHEITVNRGEKADVMLATTLEECHLLMTVFDNDSIYSSKWITLPRGLNHLKVDVPTENCQVTFIGMLNYQTVSRSIELSIDHIDPGISITAESFRDKITPGAAETWRFRITDTSGNPRKAAMIVGMYNKALDQIEPYNMTLDFSRGSVYRRVFSFKGELGSDYVTYSRWQSLTRDFDCPSLTEPYFQLYGMSFGRRTIYVRGTRPMMKMMQLTGSANGVGTDMYDVVEQVTESSADYAVSLEEEVVGSVDNDGGGTDDGSNDTDSFMYRDSSVPLAFFRPMLTTDEAGRLSLTFTVPDANTTWRFNALAFTDDLLKTSMTRDVMASKPLMVQPNLPRFVRTGDVVTIRSSVMNNTDSAMAVNTRIELFDPSDGRLILTRDFDSAPAAMSSDIVSVDFTAPADMAFIGFRIKSSTDGFADGEQSLIPVLSSGAVVIDSKPFYIEPSENYFEMAVEKPDTASRVVLTFSENPTWEVVTALPGILASDASTAPQAAAAIFSAAVARGIIKDNPAIAMALSRWIDSDRSDSTLVSMLERNSDLKIMLLRATPWVMDARSDSERMTRLALIFDKKNIDKVFSTNIALLSKLSTGKGWKWTSQSPRESLWATERVLDLLGRLNRLGYLPDNNSLNSMIRSAVVWVDSEYAAMYRRTPKGNYTGYVAIRDRFPAIKQSTAAAKVTQSVLQYIIGSWKRSSLADKGVYALILNDHGYNATARSLLRSIREFAEYKPQKGMYWPSLNNQWYSPMTVQQTTAVILEAFAAVEPGCQEIDRIRQWLIYEKEAQNWGNSVSTSAVIASVLTTSRRFIAPAQGVTVTVGDKEILPDAVERVTGTFRTDISADIAVGGSMLKVVKPGDSPSWGAVISTSFLPVTEVKATGCEAVTIEKNLYTLVGDGEGIEAVASDGLTVGSKVRVELLIKVDRDMDYVAITDERPACFEPVEQLPEPIIAENIYFYRENRDAVTNIFVDRLPKGVYRLSYDMWVNNAGVYSTGIATLQSQYAPALTAHSAGGVVRVSGYGSPQE